MIIMSYPSSLERAESDLFLPQFPSPPRVESSKLGKIYCPATSAPSSKKPLPAERLNLFF